MTNRKVIKNTSVPNSNSKGYKVRMSRIKRQRIVKILGSKTILTMTSTVLYTVSRFSHFDFLNVYSIHQVTFLNNKK